MVVGGLRTGVRCNTLVSKPKCMSSTVLDWKSSYFVARVLSIKASHTKARRPQAFYQSLMHSRKDMAWGRGGVLGHASGYVQVGEPARFLRQAIFNVIPFATGYRE